ncbi:NACHT domain-containing protein [Rhodococcus pyridinivorans]
MQYDYERFTPDRFQEFCQSLLAQQYTDIQCYPVGQKDGGRDAVSGHGTPDAIAFQVKFKRDRMRSDDGFKLVKGAVDGELEKVKRLADKGATRYVLMTNIAGTSATDSGTMDKVQAYLDAVMPIPSQVWWRSDLDARLNNSYDLKWAFSEVVTSADMFRMLISEGLGTASTDRMVAIRSYLAEQYRRDEKVKFKQADLQSSELLSLFIDVPIRIDIRQGAESSDSSIPRSVAIGVLSKRDHSTMSSHGKFEIGGASLLLHPSAQIGLKRVVIEGAPGQGKSTLTQYVCQVHRMRILARERDLKEIPQEHRDLPTRIPFKIDLRDLSSWLQRRSPFTGSEVPDGEVSSVETFIAHQVNHQSGGHEFRAKDLNLLLSNSPALLFFDGLDEVATLEERRTVVDAIDAASVRIDAVSPTTQIIITSRPAATPNTPRFTPESWTYLSLSSIKQRLVYEYTDRWGRARNLSAGDIKEIKEVLARKLESSHLKDLARNAMQLTILLNLVHARGQALPDHRTSLYDSYVEVFFNRESDKSRTVRDNRQLLVDLHGFLAWRVQSDAEANHTNGRLTHDELRNLIADFISRREYDDDVVSALFDGVVQRIVALVSRVEGTFEFEVQPLREYFAARHLYDTASYSPSGSPQKGTKPEIFESISPNPFWLNTTRFYAGCYSVGELAGLAEQVEELLGDGVSAKTSFPRTVATSLLADRVFSQKPRIIKRMANVALDPLAFRYAARNFIFESNSVQVNLPESCGRDVAIKKCLDRSLRLPHLSSRKEAGRILSRIGDEDELFAAWIAQAPQSSEPEESVIKWLQCGVQSSIVSRLDESTAINLATEFPAAADILIEGGHDYFTQSDDSQLGIIRRFADGELPLESMNGVLGPVVTIMSQVRSGVIAYGMLHLSPFFGVENFQYGLSPALSELVQSVDETLKSGKGSWRESREHWDELISTFNSVLGDSWFGWQLAVTALESLNAEPVGGIQDPTSGGSASIDFILRAIRSASDSDWWASLFNQATSDLEARVALLLILKFGRPQALSANLSLLEENIDSLSSNHFGSLLDSLARMKGKEITARSARGFLEPVSSSRLRVAFASRCSKPVKYSTAVGYSQQVAQGDRYSADYCLGWLANDSTRPRTVDQWRTYASACRRLHAESSGNLSEVYLIFDDSTRMPAQVAGEVLDDCDSYPEFLVSHADRILSALIEPTAVRTTASNDHWAADE